jgi:hypothetical protein
MPLLEKNFIRLHSLPSDHPLGPSMLILLLIVSRRTP